MGIVKTVLNFLPENYRQKFWEINHIFWWKYGHYKSLFEREQRIQAYLRKHKIRKLQVGCWPYLRKGWLNTELYGSDELIPLDLLKKMPLPNESIDFIFSEHVHEHFSLENGQKMLKEFHRVLRKNGKIRIATPNLEFLIKLYQKRKTPLQKKYIKWSAQHFVKIGPAHETFVINNFVRAWGHEFVYDFDSLKWCLEAVGFTNVERFVPGESNTSHLKRLESHWKSTLKDFNNLETIVVEATKK